MSIHCIQYQNPLHVNLTNTNSQPPVQLVTFPATTTAMKSGNKISQIVRLKQVVNIWRRRVPSSGSLAVYVGSDHRRFVILTRFLNLLVFVSFLNKAEEEFGFQFSGLMLPCDVVLFEKLVNVLTVDEQRFGAYNLDEFTAMFSDSGVKCRHETVGDCRSFTLLLRRARV